MRARRQRPKELVLLHRAVPNMESTAQQAQNGREAQGSSA
jgi:hypothetical protein